MSKGGTVLPSAQTQTAGETNRSRLDRARLGLLALIGVIVAMAMICIAVAVLSSAQHANEVAANSQQLLIRRAINDHAGRALHHLESIALTPRAALRIRDNFDLAWMDRRVGQWLQNFYGNDAVVVLGADDQVEYVRSQITTELASVNLRGELAPVVGLLRGRLSGLPANTVPVIVPADLSKPDRSVAVITRFLDKPAVIAAIVVGAAANFADGNAHAPIVLSVKYIDGQQLQIDDFHMIEGLAPAPDERVIELSDSYGNPVVRLAWKPARPGGAVVASVMPFIALAIVAFALLIIIVMRYMQRTRTAISTGERQLRHLAMHDPVCRLPNRIYFAERLERAIAEVRDGGPTVVARLGGDEFAIIMTCASDGYSLQAIAERILSAVCAPFIVSGHGINIGASIGIAVIDSCVQDAGDILRYADMALYRAKNEGRNRACIYDAAMDADLSNRKLLESALRQAIKNQELHVVYQPIVNPSGQKLMGVEALARWVHPVHGEIPPARFIPIAEHSGLIVELGEFMLRRACLDGRNWPALAVAVNVSPLQFRRPDFVELIECILTETGFDPDRLELELTESTLLGNLEHAELSMLQLKGIGVCFALDDFGTGYSSLLYLRRFPFDKLKIDSSFVRSIEKAADAAAIVHAVVSLGRGLGMRVTAEGVETAEQHLFLRAAGVHSMQGFRFGRPVAAAEIDHRLATPEAYRVSSPDQEIALAG
jgi:EAL domain-containing protein (putative c-di-GMP-specific phosphodiesterase class I)/GGDEF domain-containing protein